MIIVFIGLFALVCYIVALIKTRKGEMTLIANRNDLYFLGASFIFPAIGFQIPDYGLAIFCFILGGGCFLRSAVYSIKENRDNYFHAFISISAKFFVSVMMLFVLLQLLQNAIRRTTKEVNGKEVPMTYSEQRVYDNDRNLRLKLATTIGGFLLFSLIGTHLNHKGEKLEE